MDREKLFQKIRTWERELIYASPTRAGKLASKIVKYKAQVFDERKKLR